MLKVITGLPITVLVISQQDIIFLHAVLQSDTTVTLFRQVSTDYALRVPMKQWKSWRVESEKCNPCPSMHFRSKFLSNSSLKSMQRVTFPPQFHSVAFFPVLKLAVKALSAISAFVSNFHPLLVYGNFQALLILLRYNIASPCRLTTSQHAHSAWARPIVQRFSSQSTFACQCFHVRDVHKMHQ